MAAKPLPSADDLRSLFHYNPKTGRLTWRKRPNQPGWNSRFAGRRAGGLSSGRWKVLLPGHGVRPVARIIWKMVHDEEPEMVDHIDCNPRNDRLSNLRSATCAQNARNARSRTRTGFKGVTYVRSRNRWKAAIRVEGRSVSLGYFNDPAEAHAAYVAAAEKHFGEFARVR